MKISKTKKENNFFIHFHFVIFLFTKVTKGAGP